MIEIPFIFSIVKISMDFLASRVVLFSSVGLKFQKKTSSRVTNCVSYRIHYQKFAIITVIRTKGWYWIRNSYESKFQCFECRSASNDISMITLEIILSFYTRLVVEHVILTYSFRREYQTFRVTVFSIIY